MSTPLDVRCRTAKALDQELHEPSFRPCKVVRGVKRGQHIVLRNLPVERRYDSLESLWANRDVHLVLFHRLIVAVQGIGGALKR